MSIEESKMKLETRGKNTSWKVLVTKTNKIQSTERGERAKTTETTETTVTSIIDLHEDLRSKSIPERKEVANQEEEDIKTILEAVVMVDHITIVL